MLFWQRTIAEVAAELQSDARHGLSDDEARKRLARHGLNELEAEEPVPAWRRFLAQFEDVLVILLLVATVISTLIWLWERDAALPYEALAIAAVVLLNATMGYMQEARAEAAVAALRAMSAATATVIRGGERKAVPATSVVPGDLIIVEEGATIPADARVVESTALRVAEAALTGESVATGKETAPIEGEPPLGDRRNMIFSGTFAAYGHGRALVTATGMQTEMGRIAGLLQQTEDEVTPLQRELDRTGRLLGIIVIAIAVVMIGTILVVDQVHGLAAMFEVLILGVALAVAAVPEGLPAIVTAVLSLGVQRMAKRNAIVRHLAAVETLGSATVIASDKTGTLTKNEMTVRAAITASGRVAFTGSGYAPDGEVRCSDGAPVEGLLESELRTALTAASRANNASFELRDGRWTIQGDPTEAALVVAAAKFGLEDADLDDRLPRIGEVPFSSERKMMTTIHRQDDRVIAFTKGAPDVLLARCTHELAGNDVRLLTAARRDAIETLNESLTSEALRTLGVAFRDLERQDEDAAVPEIEHGLTFAGIIGMMDPPRPEAKDAVAVACGAGIRPIMITGDHPGTASVIARELGIATDGVVTGLELDAMADAELGRVVRVASVYARVNPEHKMRIVSALQQHGEVVAMTGDGVNDAPALKRADIGTAMGISGTDVSKEASDIILADDNFATIVAAVNEGRGIFTNIRKFLRYLLSSNIGEVITMFLGVIFAKTIGLDAMSDGLVLPLLATQILWINLVTDGAPALALGVDPADAGVMHRPPRATDEPVITRRMWSGIVWVGVVIGIGTLAVLDASLPGGLIEGSGSIAYAQTMAFTTLMLFQVFNVFNARSDDESALPRLFTNRWLWLAVVVSIALQAAVIYVPFLQRAFSTTPLSFLDWMLCTAVASTVLWLREIEKLLHHAMVGQTVAPQGAMSTGTQRAIARS